MDILGHCKPKKVEGVTIYISVGTRGALLYNTRVRLKIALVTFNKVSRRAGFLNTSDSTRLYLFH